MPIIMIKVRLVFTRRGLYPLHLSSNPLKGCWTISFLGTHYWPTQISLFVDQTTLFLAINCHSMVPATVGSHIPSEFRKSSLMAGVLTDISGSERTDTLQIPRNVCCKALVRRMLFRHMTEEQVLSSIPTLVGFHHLQGTKKTLSTNQDDLSEPKHWI